MADLESMTKKELESYAKEQFGVDLARNLSKEHMIQEIEAMEGTAASGDGQDDTAPDAQAEQDGTPTETPVPTPSKVPALPKGVKDVPPETLEAAVQVAALLYRRDGADPAGAYLLAKCGQIHVEAVASAGADPDEVATWACAEALRRSPARNHEAIVAQRIA